MKFLRDKNVPVFITGKEQLETQDIVRLLQESERFTNKYKKNKDYYYGKHEILSRTFEDPSKPNNRIVTNLPKYICQIRTGYFSSSPLSMECENQNYLNEIRNVLDYNDFKKTFAELDLYSSVYGHAFLVLYLDDEGEISMSAQKPTDWILVRDNTLEQKPRFAIRYYAWWDDVDNTQCYDIELYTKDEIIIYEGTPNSLKEVSRRNHYFGRLPVIEFCENSSRHGSYEDVIGLIDAYETILSDSTNTINYFNDCYLVLEGVEVEEEDILQMRQNKVMVVPEGCSASFLMKNINETYNKNILQEIRENIFVVACCPLLSDSSFSSNSSGVAINYKLYSMEKSIQNKENDFRKSFNEMFGMIRNILNLKGGKYTVQDKIILTFTRSNPVKDLTAIADAVSKLGNVVSRKTLLSQLDFVGDVQMELEAFQREKEEEMDFQIKYMDVYNGELDHTIEDNNNEE